MITWRRDLPRLPSISFPENTGDPEKTNLMKDYICSCGLLPTGIRALLFFYLTQEQWLLASENIISCMAAWYSHKAVLRASKDGSKPFWGRVGESLWVGFSWPQAQLRCTLWTWVYGGGWFERRLSAAASRSAHSFPFGVSYSVSRPLSTHPNLPFGSILI